MAFNQCRGKVLSIAAQGTKRFVTIKAETQFDCKKNMIRETVGRPPDSAVYNVFIKIEPIIPPALPTHVRLDPVTTLILPEDKLIFL